MVYGLYHGPHQAISPTLPSYGLWLVSWATPNSQAVSLTLPFYGLWLVSWATPNSQSNPTILWSMACIMGHTKRSVQPYHSMVYGLYHGPHQTFRLSVQPYHSMVYGLYHGPHQTLSPTLPFYGLWLVSWATPNAQSNPTILWSMACIMGHTKPSGYQSNPTILWSMACIMGHTKLSVQPYHSMVYGLYHGPHQTLSPTLPFYGLWLVSWATPNCQSNPTILWSMACIMGHTKLSVQPYHSMVYGLYHGPHQTLSPTLPFYGLWLVSWATPNAQSNPTILWSMACIMGPTKRSVQPYHSMVYGLYHGPHQTLSPTIPFYGLWLVSWATPNSQAINPVVHSLRHLASLMTITEDLSSIHLK